MLKFLFIEYMLCIDDPFQITVYLVYGYSVIHKFERWGKKTYKGVHVSSKSMKLSLAAAGITALHVFVFIIV